ncbi:MAG: TolC family protein [Rhodocyclaceae bacterium]
MSLFRLGSAVCLIGTASLSAHALSLDQALQAAAQRAPEMIAASADSQAAQAMTIQAGALPDPKLAVWVDDLPTTGGERFRPGAAKRMVSLMQEVPNTARREAEQRLADAEARGAQAQARFARLNVRRETTLAWLTVYYLDQRLTVLDEQDGLNRQSQQRDLAAITGGASPTGAFGARLEALDLQDARDDLAAQRRQAVARLARWTGDDLAREPLAGALPAWLTATAHDDAGVAELPDIRAAALQQEAANAEVALARAATRPNWAVELGVGLDAMDKNMAMLKFTFDLPLFQGTRQDPRIAAAQAKVDKSQAEREARLLDARTEVAALAAEREALQRQLARIDRDTLPLLERQSQVALAGVAGGKGETGAVLDVRRARLAARMRHVELEGRLAEANARLFFLTGDH